MEAGRFVTKGSVGAPSIGLTIEKRQEVLVAGWSGSWGQNAIYRTTHDPSHQPRHRMSEACWVEPRMGGCVGTWDPAGLDGGGYPSVLIPAAANSPCFFAISPWSYRRQPESWGCAWPGCWGARLPPECWAPSTPQQWWPGWGERSAASDAGGEVDLPTNALDPRRPRGSLPGRWDRSFSFSATAARTIIRSRSSARIEWSAP